MAKPSGLIVAVSISAQKGIPKKNVQCVTLIAGQGIDGDAHAGPGDRQVSLLSMESIDRMRQIGADVSPGAFAENITTGGVDLSGLVPGDRVRIGDAELLVTQLGKECHQRCAIYFTVGDCVMPREGVFARVVTGGKVRPGDCAVVHKSAVATKLDQRQKISPLLPGD